MNSLIKNFARKTEGHNSDELYIKNEQNNWFMGNSVSNEDPKEKIYSISYLLQKLSSNLIADKKLLQTLTIIENKLHRLSSALTDEFCVNNGAAILLGIIKSNIQGIYSLIFI